MKAFWPSCRAATVFGEDQMVSPRFRSPAASRLRTSEVMARLGLVPMVPGLADGWPRTDDLYRL
ncbi:hypothetical protein JOF47_001848 [Paeniglutamicibacter kerguelensis]|uniref:Uncharacterized protein n=1 Tax=Paeniglutamicibacter kerguelensis TaxID=254788 RepID=A0ABS4XCY5_9MICC|nr:hypothetical protein [Paeniglutamicibacter kerguelensis]